MKTRLHLRLRIGYPLLLAVGLASCGCRFPETPAPAAGINAGTNGAFHRMVIGLAEDYPEESRLLANARRDLEVVATNDLRVLRIAFGWDAIEPEPGRYDWGFWDAFVRLAADEYGVTLIPYVCYTPLWASSSQDADYWRHPPVDEAHFAKFMREIVARYRGRITHWEIWNEPDNPAYWRGSVDQFAALLQAGARAVHETDGRAKVVAGGLAWDLEFLETLLTNRPAMEHVDIVNLHNYYETWASEPLENIPEYVGRAADLIHRHGPPRPLWMAEVGYSSFRRGRHVSQQYEALYPHEHTPQGQAAALFRVLTLLLASGNVSLVTWYRINDLPPAQEVIGDENNRSLGVLDERGRPKPALAALRFFRSLFPAGSRCRDSDTRIEKEIQAPAETHVFERPDGSVVVIAWLRSYVPGERAQTIALADRRRARVSLMLPLALAAAGEKFDETGTRRGVIRVEWTGKAASRVAGMELRGGEVTVVVLPPRDRRFF